MALTVGQSFYVDHISLERPLQSAQLSQYTSARDWGKFFHKFWENVETCVNIASQGIKKDVKNVEGFQIIPEQTTMKICVFITYQ